MCGEPTQYGYHFSKSTGAAGFTIEPFADARDLRSPAIFCRMRSELNLRSGASAEFGATCQSGAVRIPEPGG